MKIETPDGRELVIDINAMADFEEEFGEDFYVFLERFFKSRKVSDNRKFVYIALKQKQPATTLKDAGECLQKYRNELINDLLPRLMKRDFPSPEQTSETDTNTGN